MSDPLALALVVTAITWLLSQLGLNRQAYVVVVVIALVIVLFLVIQHFGGIG